MSPQRRKHLDRIFAEKAEKLKAARERYARTEEPKQIRREQRAARAMADPKERIRRAVAYREYMNSVEWKMLRMEILRKRGRRCESCGQTKGEMHLHHLNYDHLGKELPHELLVLCRACHMNRHKS